jgi:TetR/AcrR family transcriptional repressor of bet genes
MPKLGMEPIRRRQLIDATLASLHENGFADTTVSRISARAGVSTGIVHHYFQGKGDLLEATMRAFSGDLRRDVVRRLQRARSPRQRVEAVLAGNLAPMSFSAVGVAAWLAFWAQVPKATRLARVQTIIIGRLHSNLRHALRRMVPAADAERIATGLAVMLDGIWLRAALRGGKPDAAAARRLLIDYLDSQLAAQRRRRR